MGTSTGGARAVGQWMLTQNIGAGSFAVVWKARHAVSGQVVAIKEISTDKLNKKLRQSLETEVSILKQITHRNIVQLLEVIEEKGRIFLVMEYCAGGDLAKFIRRTKRIPEATARALLRQLSAGLRELWSRNLVHRDLKPQNLLLSTNEAGEKLLKIADFGFARSLQPQGLAETLCGSPLYMAPEILQFHKYDAKADLWSVGAILFELVVGRPPFNGANHVALLRAIERQEAQIPEPIRKALSASCAALLHGLLRRNPVERLTFEEFFAHPFLRSASRSGSSQSGSRHSSQSSSLTSSAEPSPLKPQDREMQAQPVPEGSRQCSLPRPSPDDNLPFLLDEDPSRGSSKQGSQTGSSAHNAQLLGPLPGQAGPQQQPPQPSVHREPERLGMIQQKRAWSLEAKQALQAPMQSVSERSHSLGTQPVQKPLASNPFLISSGRGQVASHPMRASHSGRSAGPPAFMPATPQQALPPGVGDLLDEDEDYVIIEGVSPFSSAHGIMPRKGSTPAAQPMPSSLASAGTPPLHRGSPYSRSLPESSQSSALYHYGSSPQAALRLSSASVTSPVTAAAASASTFSSGVSRLELLVLTARVLEGLAVSKHAGGAPQDALALRLVTIQVLREAMRLAPDEDSRMQSSVMERTLTVQRIGAELRGLIRRCEDSAAAAAEGMDDGEQLPDVWQLAYKAALALAKAAAVDELLGNAATSARAYHKAGSLLYFMCEDAPRMELSPPVRLPPGERQRLRKCTADVFTRYCAVCAGGPAASQQQVRPLHLSAVRAEAAHVQP